VLIHLLKTLLLVRNHILNIQQISSLALSGFAFAKIFQDLGLPKHLTRLTRQPQLSCITPLGGAPSYSGSHISGTDGCH
jgi:hypothetical protein